MSAYSSDDSMSPASPSPGAESPIAQAPLRLTQDRASGREGQRNEAVGLLETTAFGTSACTERADPVSSSPATSRAVPTAEEEGKDLVDLCLRVVILSQERGGCSLLSLVQQGTTCRREKESVGLAQQLLLSSCF